MTEKKEPYTNLDLETAEQLLIAAGQPELAQGMWHYTQGWRNYVQGEFGQSFVDAFDRVVGNHIGPLTALIGGLVTSQKETQDGVSALGGRFQAIEDRVQGLAARLDHKRVEIDQIKEQQATLAGEQAALAARLARLEQARDDG